MNRTTVTSLSMYGLPLGTQYPGGSDTASSYLGTTRLDGAQQFPTSFEDELERSRNYGYDTKSGLTSATDLAGQQWQYQYTAAAGSGVSYDVMSGNVSASQQDSGASAYGPSGDFEHLISKVTSPKGEITSYERGTNGRVSKVTYPDGGQRTITYGADQQPSGVVLPQGTTVSLQHDAAGRETLRTTSTGESRSLSYGPTNLITALHDNTGTTDVQHDGRGRFTGIAHPDGSTVSYTRDVLNRVTDVVVKGSATAAPKTTHYTYDPNGNIVEITDPNGGVTGFSYDDVDRLQQRVLPNGVTSTFSYDSRDRALSVVHRNAQNEVLASVTYVRSPSGEPTKITREDGSYVQIEYDAALRVSKESHFDATSTLIAEVSYGYDLDGNRTSKTTLTGNQTYSYSAGFKLTGASGTGTDGNETYQHDGGGRLIGVDRGGSYRTIEYDSYDHVTRVVDDGIENVRYTYNGLGRRMTVNNGTGALHYVVAPNLGDGFETPQAVADATGNVVASYVFAGDTPFMKITPSGVSYYLQDAMGTVIGTTDASGSSASTIQYDAFGNITSYAGTNDAAATAGDFRFQGMWLDQHTGFYYVRARYYDGHTGRFISRDPLDGVLGRPETQNPYVFASSNPYRFADPSGLLFNLNELTVTQAIVGILATTAVASLASYLKQFQGTKAGSFAAGAVTGLASSAAIGIAVVTFPAVATVATALALVGGVYGVVQILVNWDEVTDWGARVATGNGSQDDYYTAGVITGAALWGASRLANALVETAAPRDPARILSEIFGKGRAEGSVAQAETILADLAKGTYKPPADLTPELLDWYEQVANNAINGPKGDPTGVQALRLQIIEQLRPLLPK